jgi:HlyD family secretion protein
MKNLSALKIVPLATLILSCNNGDDGVKPAMKPLMEAVYASGFVVAGNEYEVYAQSEGYISDKLVDDGDEVKKGEALYVISSEQQSARNRIARETFELAQKNYSDRSPVLSELKAALDVAATKLRYDSSNFIRYSNLIKNNATSQSEYDRIRLLYDNSRNDFALQKSRYEKTKNQLSLELQNAKNNLVISSDEAGRYIIRSEVDGKVFLAAKEKGEMIRRNEMVAIVGNADRYILQLNVDELDVQRVKVGQEVFVKIDAYPEKVFEATINKIYPLVDRKQQSVRADAQLKENLPGLFSGLALEANIIINKKSAALVIPKSSLMPGDSVMIQTDDGDKKVKVKTGIQTLDEVEILEGLDTNNLVVMSQKN